MEKQNTRISDTIFEELKKSIASLEYKPGELLDEETLSKKYNVSRTPIREALKTLEIMGLVRIIPKVGNIVAHIDAKETVELLKIKASLEGHAGEIAAKSISQKDLDRLKEIVDELKELKEKGNDEYNKLIKLDQEFHEIVRVSTGNNTLVFFLETLNLQGTRAWTFYQTRLPGNHADTLDKMYEAISSGDPEKVRIFSEEHVMSMRDKFRNALFD